MLLKNIISNSSPSFVATLTENRHVQRILAYMQLNNSWLSEFDSVIFSFNGIQNICEYFLEEYSKKYTNKPILLYSENLGHTFGTLDNDRKIFEYAQDHKEIEYVWKFSADVLANSTIFDIDVDESCDFFYVNNIGYAAFDKYSQDELIQAIQDQSYFYPQTNHYIYKNNLDTWMPSKDQILTLKEKYDQAKQVNENVNPWDVLSGKEAFLPEGEGCACEAYLAQTILANNCKKQQLLSKDILLRLTNLIKEHLVYDGSHKNLLYTELGGLCHYHIMNGMAVQV